MLNEIPNMNTGGVYSKNPAGFRYDPPSPAKRFVPDVDGNWPSGVPGTSGASEYIRPQGYWIDDSDWDTKYVPDMSNDSILESSTNTDGFIDPDNGTVKTALPPNSRHFILGPLVDGYVYNHGTDDYTNIGYIQKDTRQFVLLATIEGHWTNDPIVQGGSTYTPRQWNGTSGQFTQNNPSFTLAMAEWFKDKKAANNFTKDFPYFYSGGVPQQGLDNQPPGSPGGMKGGNAPGTNGGGNGPGDAEKGKATTGSGGSPDVGTETPQADPEGGDAGDLDLWGLLWDKMKKNWQDNTKDLGQDYKDHFDALSDWVDDVKDFVKSIPGKAESVADILKLAKSGVEAVPTSADALFQYLDNNDPKHPDYRKNDPRSDNYEGPYEPPADQTWRNDVGKQIKNSIPKWSDMEKRAKESPDGKTELTNFEITSISQNMKPISGNGDMRFHTFLNSLPVSGNEYGDEVPGEDGNTPITTFTLDKDGNIEIVTNYRFSDRDDVSSGGPLMKLYVQQYMNKEKGDVSDPGVFPFYDKDGGTKQVGTTHDINMRLKLNINGGNSSTWPAQSTDVKKFKKAGMKLMNSYSMEYKPEQVLLESKKRILREITQPLKEIKELPKTQKLEKYRPNFKGKYKPQNTPNVTASKKSDEMVRAKNAAGQTWRTKDKYWGGYESQERINVVYDKVGHGHQYFDKIVSENLSKKNLNNRKIQEHFNIIAHEKAMRKLDSTYVSPFRNIQEQETLDAPKDPLYKKVAKRLNKEIDYPNKPSAKGYPNEAPPELDPNTSMHPKYGQRYKYDKLDPDSAEAMPPTDNPEIDANVQKSLDVKRKARKIKNLLGKK